MTSKTRKRWRQRVRELRARWPLCVRELPVCPVRELPIPASAIMNDDGTGVFTITDEMTSRICARERLCGVCGLPVGDWIWFLGGPSSAELHGAYTDPGMHEDCAVAAIRLCPYIAHPRVPRRTEPVEVVTLNVRGVKSERAEDGWVLLGVRRYDWSLQATDKGPAIVYQPDHRASRRRWFNYDDRERLVERDELGAPLA